MGALRRMLLSGAGNEDEDLSIDEYDTENVTMEKIMENPHFEEEEEEHAEDGSSPHLFFPQSICSLVCVRKPRR